jgi:hypothetical protein
MFTFYILNSFQFYIQNFSDGLYLSDVRNEKISRPVIAVDKSARVDFTSTITPDGSHIIKPDTSDHVMDVKNQSELIYWPRHGAVNQQFKLSLVLPKTYLIQSLGKCVEYSPSSKTYFLKPCTGHDLQKFVISTHEDEERENEVDEDWFTNSGYECINCKPKRRHHPVSSRYWYSKHKLPAIAPISQHSAHQRHVRHPNNDSY